MRKGIVYSLLTVFPAFLLSASSYLAGAGAERFIQGQAGDWYSWLMLFLPSISIVFLMFLFFTSLRFSSEKSYRLLVLFLGILYFGGFVYNELLPLPGNLFSDDGRYFFIQNMAIYGAFYVGTFLLSLLQPKINKKHFV